MPKMKKIIVFFTLLIIITIFGNINVANALEGNQGDTSSVGSTACTVGWCVNSSNYGLRFTIVDKNGNTKGKGLNVMIKLYNNADKAPIKSRFGKGSYNVNEATIGDFDVKIQNLVSGFSFGEYSSNYSSTIDPKIKAWVEHDETFEIIKNLSGASVVSTDYLVVEPLTVAVEKGSTKYYYGTMYELTNLMSASIYYGARVYLSEYMGNAMFSTDLTINIPNAVKSSGKTNSGQKLENQYTGSVAVNATNAARWGINKNLWKKNTYGVAIYSLSSVVKSCDININNDPEETFNWTKYDPNCDIDNDGSPDGCWKKISGGCCDTAIDKYGKTTVYDKYPQCAESDCVPDLKKYINGSSTGNLDLPSCGNSSTTLQNYFGGSDLSLTTAKYCLANNKLYTGKINGKYYGCEIKDEFSFPGNNMEKLSIGEYFYWPTSVTLQKVSAKANSYPLTRTTTLRCQAYTYKTSGDDMGQLEYKTLTAAELNTIKNRFTQTGNLKLNFQGSTNGDIIEEPNTLTKSASNIGDGTFKVVINNTYTLKEVTGGENVYAYYNQEKLAYTNYIITSQLSKYVQYKFPIIPYGDYVRGMTTEEFDDSILIEYGINYASIGVSGSRLTGSYVYNGAYMCRKNDVHDGEAECKCPRGTKHEGIDLMSYLSAPITSSNFAAKCAVAQSEYCDDTIIGYKCPDGTDLTACMAGKRVPPLSYTTLEAYNACYAERCTPPTIPKTPVEVIYRPIFLNDPFPSINGSIRKPGDNWGGTSSISGGSYTGLVEKYITSTAGDVYQGDPMYRFEISPAGLREIRSYNSTHKYDDFEMECDESTYCVSIALRGAFSTYFIEGTCLLKSEAIKRGNDDCRIDALNN